MVEIQPLTLSSSFSLLTLYLSLYISLSLSFSLCCSGLEQQSISSYQ